jgi:hypothetical protein
MIFIESCWLPAKKPESKIQGLLGHQPKKSLLSEALPSPVELWPPSGRVKEGNVQIHHMINEV